MREGKSLCVAGTHRNTPLPPWQKFLGSPGLDHDPGTVLGDAVTELTWNTGRRVSMLFTSPLVAG